MGEAILYNRHTMTDIRYDWNAAFNNYDFVQYIINKSPVYYIGSETFIPDYEYSNETNFIGASFPNVYLDIGSHAFDGCYNMSEIWFDLYSYTKSDGQYFMRSIGAYAFKNCSLLEFFATAMYRHIGSHAFENLRKLSKYSATNYSYPYDYIDLSEFQIDIGDYAFANCISLSSVYMPFVKSIGAYAFTNCAIDYCYIGSSKCSYVGSHAFESCSKLYTIANINYNGNSSNLVSIGAYAFKNCSQLYSFCGYYVGTIGSHAFENCSSLYYIGNYSNSVSYCKGIMEYAFNGCSRIYSLNLNISCSSNVYYSSNNRCNISDYAFANCINMREIHINNIGYIGKSIFYGLSSISYNIYLNGCFDSEYYIESHILDGCTADFLYMSSFFNISHYAFTGLSSFRGIVGEFLYVGSHAFENCSNLNNFVGNTVYGVDISVVYSLPYYISSGIYIGEYAFTNCYNMNSPTGGIRHIGSHAFENCYHIQGVNGPPQLEYIGAYAFNNCSNFGQYGFAAAQNTCQFIGSHAFNSCSLLSQFVLIGVSSVPILEDINAFSGIDPDYKIIINSTMYSDFINDSVWRLISEHIVYSEG